MLNCELGLKRRLIPVSNLSESQSRERLVRQERQIAMKTAKIGAASRGAHSFTRDMTPPSDGFSVVARVPEPPPNTRVIHPEIPPSGASQPGIFDKTAGPKITIVPRAIHATQAIKTHPP